MRLNNMFHSHNHAGFWKALKNQKKTPYRSSLKPQDFANHFKKPGWGGRPAMPDPVFQE